MYVMSDSCVDTAFFSTHKQKSLRTEAFSGSGKRDSNPRHPAWEAGALPTELFPHVLTRGHDLALRSGLVNEYISAPDGAWRPVI